MSKEQLWKLFPIFLTNHHCEWKEYFLDEQEHLNNLLSECAIKRIIHIGSTAIKNIWAKPIIDILIELDSNENMKMVSEILEKNGYICMRIESEKRRSFNKGYTLQGFAEKVFHLHLRYYGDNDEVYFRDYLNEHAEIAKLYEEMKLNLWKQYEHDRDGYTEAKREFVKKYTEIAKQQKNS